MVVISFSNLELSQIAVTSYNSIFQLIGIYIQELEFKFLGACSWCFDFESFFAKIHAFDIMLSQLV